MRRHPWWTTAVGLVVLSIVLLLYAGTRPSYDAYGWLGWGYQSLHGTLNLGGAPSWKPLPFLFTVPFALAGHYELWLWMITCVAVSLAGPVFAGRIAFRLAAEPLGRSDTIRSRAQPAPRPASSGWLRPSHPAAAIAAAVFAGAAVLGLEDYFHYILSAQSDPMIVTFVLAATDMFLIGRYRWTLVLGVLASMGRPEVWPFLGVFMLWAWFRAPGMRWMLIAGVGAIAFMWFGIPTITNGRPDIAGQLAQGSPRELRHNRLFGTIGRFTELEYLPVWIAALGAVAFAVLRRHFVVLALAAGSAAWVVIEIAFAYHGWPALSRYMFEAAAGGSVVAGVAVGWALGELPALGRRVPPWIGLPIVAVLVGTLVPGAVARVRSERSDLHHERDRTHQIGLLQSTTDLLGGARHIENCGQPVTDVGYVSALAWLFHRDVGSVGGLQQHIMAGELRNPRLPKVLFTPLTQGGWGVRPWHTRPSLLARCRGLHAVYTGGVLIRR